MGVVAFRGCMVLGLLLAMAGCQAARGPANDRVSLRTRDPRADGVVIRVDAETGEAYVSLTKADRIAPGMQFRCYNGRLPIPISVLCSTEEDTKQSLASLEILEVGERFSRCRILPLQGRVVHSGDLVFNVTYHANRGRSVHFAVGGEFDLDGDGIVTAAERAQLERMIVAWGGVVDDKITVRTDYLILGKRPAEPVIGEHPVVPRGVVDERAQVRKNYAARETEARQLAIPVLNENRALTLLGYYAMASR